MDVVVERVTSLSIHDLDALIAESEREGLRFVRRLADDLASGANRFDRPGERLFVARDDDKIVGVCGLNIDPFAAEESVGRVRRFYVAKSHRGHGIGRALLSKVIAAASRRFTVLRVRTESPAAGAIYESFGFAAVSHVADCTHLFVLEPVSLS